MPTMRPAAFITVKGSMLPEACRPSRRLISAAMPSGEGTAVYQRRQSSPSRVASIRPASCAGASGSSFACWPLSSTGSGQATEASAVVPLHEDELLEQRHVLLVLQQRTHQRRHRDLLVLALQRLERDVLGHQQLEPVEQL